MLNIDFAPELGINHPDIYEDAFLLGTEYPLLDLGISAISYAKKTLPLYEKSSSSPLEGVVEGNGMVNCAGRTALIHTLLTPVVKLDSSVVVVNFTILGNSGDHKHRTHYFNAIHDTESGEKLIIESDMKEDANKVNIGTFEPIIDPWATTQGDPGTSAPIHELALDGLSNLYRNIDPLYFKQRFGLANILVPVNRNDEGYDLVQKYLRPGDPTMPSVKEIFERNIIVLPDTEIIVLDADESNRWVDVMTYGKNSEVNLAYDEIAA